MRGPGNARIPLLCLVVMTALLAGSCAGGVGSVGQHSKLRQYKHFFEKSPEKQDEEFLSSSIAKQFDIYIVSMTMRKFPNAAFATYIAGRGVRAMPFLLGKLRLKNYPEYGSGDETTDSVKEKIIFIFRMMSRLGYYDVRNDRNAVELIRSEIENMKHDHYQDLSREYLSDILAGG